VNGFGNRLRAIAAASHLAHSIGAAFRVSWIKEPDVFPADWDEVFNPSTPVALIDYDRLRDLIGLEQMMPPVGLTLLEHRSTICLRGFSRGEQAYMSELVSLIQDARFSRIVIWAGNHFSIEVDDLHEVPQQLLASKAALYAGLRFTHDSPLATDGLTSPFRALHVRLTDRKDTAPSRGRISRMIRQRLAIDDLPWVVLSDDARARAYWTRYLEAKGATALRVGSSEPERSTSDGVLAATLEWSLIAASRELLYFSESSFASEAAILVEANGGRSFALTQGPISRFSAKARRIARTGMSLLSRAFRSVKKPFA